MEEGTHDPPVLLYDGICGFCNKAVQTVLKHDKGGTLRFAALQSAFGKAVKERHSILTKVDSMALLERERDATEERIYLRSDAALRVAAYLGGAWKLFLVASLIPRPIRDFFYDLFARYRYKLFGKYESCLLPLPDVRARFLE